MACVYADGRKYVHKMRELGITGGLAALPALVFNTQDGNLAIVKLLVKHKAQVDTVVNGMTPLWVACHQNRLDIAKVLLEGKADPTRKVQEWSPIMLAEREGNAELANLLRQHAPAGHAEPGMVAGADPKKHLTQKVVEGTFIDIGRGQ